MYLKRCCLRPWCAVEVEQIEMSGLLQTVITADELYDDVWCFCGCFSVLNRVSAASVVQQNAATLFYCEAPELFCQHEARRVFIFGCTAPFWGWSQCFKSVQVSSPAAKNISVLSVFWRSRSLPFTLRDWRRTRHMKREVCELFLVYPYFLLPK